MSESPTGSAAPAPASQEPTGQVEQPQSADVTNQETISHEQSQEAVSTDAASQNQTQTQENGGSPNDDDGLAKFAKSQGFDLETAGEDVKRALKIAHDNQKAFRNNTSNKKVAEVAQEFETPKANESEDEAFRREFRQYKYEQTTNKFWGEDGRDRALEPAMVEILNEKKEQYGPDYARNLSQDLPTLYDLARVRSGAVGNSVDPEAIRREERESIRQQSTASATPAHATTQTQAGGQKIDREWLSTKYDPSNPEHRKLVDEAVANGDL